MLVLALLPALSLAAIVALFALSGWELRRAALAGVTTWGVVVVAGTELLSFFRAVDQVGLAVFWLVVLVATCGILTRVKPVGRRRPRSPAQDRDLSLLLAGVGVTLVGTLVTAIVAAPNDWDSMTYHLARVLPWIEQQSAYHHAAHHSRQLYNPPFAEWALLHLHGLTGGDRLVNLVQWLSFGGVLVGVSVIAEELGAARRGQVLATAFAGTLPLAVLQAPTTQNDLVASLWLMCFLAFALPLRRGHARANAVLLAGSACGLLVLTKTPGAVVALPFVIWIAIAFLRRERWAAWKPAVLFALLVFAVNSGHWGRNLWLFGHPLAPERERVRFANAERSLPVVYSVSVRMSALHLQTPWLGLNRRVFDGAAGLHGLFGLEVNLPGTAYDDLPFEPLDPWPPEEYHAGAPIHTVMIGLTLVLVIVGARSRGDPSLLLYAAAAVSAFLLFNLVVRWQPTSGRLLLPVSLAWTPILGMVLDRRRLRRIVGPLFFVAFLLSFSCVFMSRHRPFFGVQSIFTTDRADQYFNSRPWERERQRAEVAQIAASGCSRVALFTRRDAYEYPFRMALKKLVGDVLFRHVGVRNESRRLAEPDFRPCVRVGLYGGLGDNKVVFIGPE